MPNVGPVPPRFSLSARQEQRQAEGNGAGIQTCEGGEKDRERDPEKEGGGREAGREGRRKGGKESERELESPRYSHFASRNNGHLENNGYRQSLGLFISATVSPRQEELEVCPVCTAPTGPELGGR